MKNTLSNMVISLTAICFAGALLVGSVHRFTKDRISRADDEIVLGAIRQVLPPFDNNPYEERTEIDVDGETITVYPGRKGGSAIGYAVQTVTRAGYSGTIRLMVGFDADGQIMNIVVLEHSETPGLGSKIADEGNPLKLSFVGRSPSDLQMSVRRDGGDIDAISASTITSRAYVQAVDRAYRAYLVASGRAATVPKSSVDIPDSVSGVTDSSSGATPASSDGGEDVSGTVDGVSGATATKDITIECDTASGATTSNE